MEYELLTAFEAVQKIEKASKSKFGKYIYYERLFEEIIGATLTWPYGAKGLVDQRNWNIEKLKGEGCISGFRKPKAYFDIFITSHSNLAMDWYPVKDRLINADFRTTDWKRWDNKWPIGGGNYNLPFNRVFMIRKFRSMHSRVNYMQLPSDTDEQLIRTIFALIDHVYRYLREFIDVIELTQFKMNYDEKKDKQGRINRIFTGFSIQPIEEIKERKI